MQIHQLKNNKLIKIKQTPEKFYGFLGKRVFDAKKEGINDFVFIFYPKNMRKHFLNSDFIKTVESISSKKVNIFSMGHSKLIKKKIKEFKDYIPFTGKSKKINAIVEEIIKDLFFKEKKVIDVSLPCTFHFWVNDDTISVGRINFYNNFKKREKVRLILEEISYICNSPKESKGKFVHLKNKIKNYSDKKVKDYTLIIEGVLLEKVLEIIIKNFN